MVQLSQKNEPYLIDLIYDENDKENQLYVYNLNFPKNIELVLEALRIEAVNSGSKISGI